MSLEAESQPGARRVAMAGLSLPSSGAAGLLTQRGAGLKIQPHRSSSLGSGGRTTFTAPLRSVKGAAHE